MLYDPSKDISTVAQVLLNAADYMEAHGWCQQAYHKGDAVCMIGALMDTQECSVLRREAWLQLREHLGIGPHKWNDEICSSKEQAVAALRAAAWSCAQ